MGDPIEKEMDDSIEHGGCGGNLVEDRLSPHKFGVGEVFRKMADEDIIPKTFRVERIRN